MIHLKLDLRRDITRRTTSERTRTRKAARSVRACVEGRERWYGRGSPGPGPGEELGAQRARRRSRQGEGAGAGPGGNLQLQGLNGAEGGAAEAGGQHRRHVQVKEPLGPHRIGLGAADVRRRLPPTHLPPPGPILPQPKAGSGSICLFS